MEYSGINGAGNLIVRQGGNLGRYNKHQRNKYQYRNLYHRNFPKYVHIHTQKHSK